MAGPDLAADAEVLAQYLAVGPEPNCRGEWIGARSRLIEREGAAGKSHVSPPNGRRAVGVDRRSGGWQS